MGSILMGKETRQNYLNMVAYGAPLAKRRRLRVARQAGKGLRGRLR